MSVRRKASHKPKRITRQQITGQQGVNFVERVVLEMGFAWHPTNAGLEAGIDGIIEIIDPDTREATNNIIQVQVKASKQVSVCADTKTEFTYLCDERDIDYWMRGNTPVVLVAVRPQGDEAYWANVKEAFADPKRRRDRHLRFDKETQRFDASAASALVRLAVPRDSGLYMPATAHRETLVSNLLEVKRFPPVIYGASTDYRQPEQIFEWARGNDLQLPHGWLLTEESIRSVYDLREDPWVQLVHRGTVEAFEVGEWADSNDPGRQREFVRLMNQVLREDMSLRGLWHSADDKCYYFPARRDDAGNLLGRRYHYRALRQKTWREVALLHSHPQSGELVYCRHNALKCNFLKIQGQWYLVLTPHYIYTTDGKRAYRYGEDLLSGMKRMEHQEAVLGQVVMWRYKLTEARSRGLFSQDDTRTPLISFGGLLEATCDRGVDDRSWLPTDIPVSEVDEHDEWGLFDDQD